jgi:large subunit ribosomal protein L6
MSRIGTKPITVPNQVSVTITDSAVMVKGPKGELQEPLQKGTAVAHSNDTLIVTRTGNDRFSKAAHGLMNRLITNMIIGVTEGYVKKLELVGTGYRAKPQGTGVVVSAGYSHPVEYKPPAEVTVVCESDTVMVVTGIDKQAVGQVAANLRAIRPPEPYQGKGIRYQGEVIRRKAGKTTKSGA